MVVAEIAAARAEGGRRADPAHGPEDLAHPPGRAVVRGAGDGRLARSHQGRDRRSAATAPGSTETGPPRSGRIRSPRQVEAHAAVDQRVIEPARGEAQVAKISRALISVSDKTGVVELARGLSRRGPRDSLDGRHGARARGGRRAGARGRATSPARPRSSTAASRRCTRASTAASSGGRPPQHRAEMQQAGLVADRSGGREPLSVPRDGRARARRSTR